MVTVDSKGRIVLPSEIREQIGLRPGNEVEVRAESGRVVVEPEDTPERIVTDLERMIDEAATNRERRHERGVGAENEEGQSILDDDPIAAKQRAIIRRGVTRSASDHTDTE